MTQKKSNSILACPLLILVVLCGIGFGIYCLVTGFGKTDAGAETTDVRMAYTENVPAPAAEPAAPAEKPAAPAEKEPAASEKPAEAPSGIPAAQPSEIPAAQSTETPAVQPSEELPEQPYETAVPLPSEADPGIDLPGILTPETELPTEPPVTEPPVTEPKEKTFQTVSEDYFSDALFIGDSRTNGLALYSPISGADYYYKTSLNIYDVMGGSNSDIRINGQSSIRGILQAGTYGKVYICFGINECGYPIDSFIDKYEEVINEIRGYQPDAIIYIQAIMVVTASKAASASYFSNSNLRDRNERLEQLADGEDVFYLEVNEVYQDGAGNLPDEYGSADGAHLKPQYYAMWKDYLMTHAIVND